MTAASPSLQRPSDDCEATHRAARLVRAIRLLFHNGFGTVELAQLFGRREPEIVALLHASEAP